jgi:2-hydroxycyclohexanecarboxyl-CoA dehydrogenase
VSRVVVVTGGASGVGLAVSEQLAQNGYRVGILDIDPHSGATIAEKLQAAGAEASFVQVDVSDRLSVEAAFAVIRAEFGPIEVFVSSAAVSGFIPFSDITLDVWERTMAVNLTGTFNCLQAALPDMVAARWGRIVTISSAAGQTGSPRQAHYAASKGGVISLTKTIALEYASKGITANTIPPFTVDTPMLRAAQASNFLPATDVLSKMIPARRLGTTHEVAAVCAFLCSDAASYITGQVIGVNGGAVT